MASSYASWPLPGILGSGVAGTAGASYRGTQSVRVFANLSQDDAPAAQASASATLSYYIQINPIGSGIDGNYINITMVSNDSLVAPEFYEAIGTVPFNAASTQLTIQAAGSTFEAGSEYQRDGTGVSGGVGDHFFSGAFDLVSGTAYLVTLSAYADIENQTGEDSAHIDPIFSFTNPADALQYEIDFSDGITNDVSATPLPATFPLFAGGLGIIGFLVQRRKRNAAALAAA